MRHLLAALSLALVVVVALVSPPTRTALADGSAIPAQAPTPTPAPAPTPAPQASAPAPTTLPPIGGAAAGGGLLDGLSSILGKLSQNGAAPQVNSWVNHGPNQPIQPGQLGGALGDQTINDLIARTGLTKEQLLAGLSTVLPQLVNNLTPKGRLPTLAELEEAGR